MTNIKQIKHLTARAGFGMAFDDLKADENITVKQAVKELFEASKDSLPFNVVKVNIDYSMIMKGDVNARKMLMQQQRQQEKDLNLAWMTQMSSKHTCRGKSRLG